MTALDEYIAIMHRASEAATSLYNQYESLNEPRPTSLRIKREYMYLHEVSVLFGSCEYHFRKIRRSQNSHDFKKYQQFYEDTTVWYPDLTKRLVSLVDKESHNFRLIIAAYCTATLVAHFKFKTLIVDS